MKYVELDGRVGDLTGVLDPGPYLERLPVLGGRLPPGARAFATDPEHYDFSGRRCVKDLLPREARRTGDENVEIRFGHSCWKHDEDLVVRYLGVSRFQADILGGRALDDLGEAAPDSLGATALGDLGEVVLDEILPHPAGCTHELACRSGTLLVVCRDLEADWVAVDCPEDLG
ncbi:hypothetical protein BM536_027805 [Streptomyces phaeoluteigriseus]|uniref:Uncharacterized protein n=1 Tax=Streptomyces phaeoluteigriseus TaxID=114686 RepID=A0A1V6MM11_9ACTN|nr:hypothetical protein [Streptomyces phaeoluteigriseus]OQD53313.1 hypothetical protein BM536_027805 [Streptomyces phaeoluteigriseus]